MHWKKRICPEAETRKTKNNSFRAVCHVSHVVIVTLLSSNRHWINVFSKTRCLKGEIKFDIQWRKNSLRFQWSQAPFSDTSPTKPKSRSWCSNLRSYNLRGPISSYTSSSSSSSSFSDTGAPGCGYRGVVYSVSRPGSPFARRSAIFFSKRTEEGGMTKKDGSRSAKVPVRAEDAVSEVPWKAANSSKTIKRSQHESPTARSRHQLWNMFREHLIYFYFWFGRKIKKSLTQFKQLENTRLYSESVAKKMDQWAIVVSFDKMKYIWFKEHKVAFIWILNM